jgi:DNA-binding transcriptional LysR family regulator
MPCNIPELKAFVAVARLGSFSGAARQLHLSQPALSRRIGQVEEDVGAPLFERTPGGVHLTEAGQAFLRHAEDSLASLHDAREAVKGVVQGGTSEFCLAFVGTLASTSLTETLRKFRQSHPAATLTLRTATSAEVSMLVARGEATLGLRYHEERDPKLVGRVIGHEPLVLVCAPGHRLAGARRVNPQRLSNETWIGFPERPGRSVAALDSVLRAFLAMHYQPGTKRILIDSLTAQKRLIEAGFGIGLLPKSGVDEELRAGSLRRLAVPAPRSDLPISVVYRRNGYLSGAAQSLLGLLERTFTPRGAK